VFLTKYYLQDQMKDDEMGRACGILAEKIYVYRDMVGESEGNVSL